MKVILIIIRFYIRFLFMSKSLLKKVVVYHFSPYFLQTNYNVLRQIFIHLLIQEKDYGVAIRKMNKLMMVDLQRALNLTFQESSVLQKILPTLIILNVHFFKILHCKQTP